MHGFSRRTLLSGMLASLPLARLAAQPRRPLRVALSSLRSVLEVAHRDSQFAAGYRVIPNVLESPFRLDFEHGYVSKPVLAEAMARRDDRTVEVTLREGVRMHDGRIMTADDWAASLSVERLLGPDAPGLSVRLAHLSTLQGVEVIDPRRVRITASKPDPVLEKRLTAWGTQIISADALRKASSYEDWARHPIGTGPYKVESIAPGERVVLRAHDAYWGGGPPVAEIHFQAVPELSSRLNGLLAGDYDIISDVTPDTMAEIERRPGHKVVGGSTHILRTVNFDVKHNAQLADPLLRRALSLAVDRKLIVDTLWDGRLTIPNGAQVPAYGALYDPARPAYACDPSRARELVRQSSYRGETIPFRITGSFVPGELSTSQALVEMWGAIGVTVRIETVESYPNLFKRPGSGIYNYSASLWYADPLSDFWRNYGANSLVQRTEQSWSHDEFNALGRLLETSMDEAERRRAFQRMVDIFDWEDPPALVLYSDGLFYGLGPGVGWSPIPAWPMEFGPGRLQLAAP